MEKIMTGFEKKLSNLKPIHVITILIIFYFIFRLLNLRILPIFNDEATYLDWGWRMVNVEGETFHSVVHAKTPLLMWLFGISQKVFTDPLLAGRIISVLTGLATAIGLFVISEEIFNRKVAVFTFLFYTLNPLFTLHDRLALMESSIAMVGVWSYILYQKMSKTRDYKYAALLGLILGAGYLIKSNAFTFSLAVVILSLVRIAKERDRKREVSVMNLIIVFTVAFVTLLPLISKSIFWDTLEQNQKYILSPGQLLKFPLMNWIQNIYGTLTMLIIYINPAVIVAGLYSIYLVFKEKAKDKKLIIFWLGIGLITTNLLVINSSVRYLVSFFPILLILGSYGFVRLFEKNKIISLLLGLLVLPTFYLSILQIFNPISYFNSLDKLSPRYSDKSDYVTSWPSGYGVKDAVNYIEKEARNSGIVVGVRLDAGNPENSVFTYFNGSKRVKPIYLDSQMFGFDIKEVDCFQTSLPLYFVSRDGNMSGLNNYFDELERFYKPENKNFVSVHKLKTDCKGKTMKLF